MGKRGKVRIDKKENIMNVPTFLNFSRIVLSFVVIYMMIIRSPVVNILIVFGIAAITDWFDGVIARRYNLVSDFGAKADMVADRFLWVGTALAFVVVFGLRGQLNAIHGVQVLLIMVREVVSAPSAIVATFSGRGFPDARYVAKLTTFFQGFALPALLLSVYYPSWIYVSLPLSVFVGIIGIISGFYYVKDVQEICDAK